ncbi:hypothetical protein [Paenibacillus mucilaginosus]|uniref:Uncharacterized protein n=2 Tax=Paenibacillus mucilaginosus TaxID=61624 RepID=H6NFH1_9BACL|nr:hypothetical protein [Paenibacillus mucilaginosus]AEI41520.1 hypothetical protein KNP414_02962 [Paenibacillus mucilaginosus KNP414]AFC30057.1 hypothetical protein PM3016_3202 [Paenibacillus mucilaginosus 3016]MCG7215440.1 hypothetical protein [Paenibacillus mucilaginosus]WDM30528.1 hypothetical protein KCX80_15855 [Paenibacillus mucilaginosus]WFA18710.1 hypothetical protein ERY13_16210 [Paenibacillus mucilaginosus]
MTEQNNESVNAGAGESSEPRKVSLADAIKNKLAQKKQDQKDGKLGGGMRAGNDAVMRSQNNKKPNNQRRRTGGS